jgi:ATP-dependent Clp protease, protease subunit
MQIPELELYNRVNTQKTATMLLYGTIGDKIDGDLFAQELAALDRENDIINIRINSSGGSVVQGLSIVNAILNATAHINTFVDGIAASMAGVIAVCGDRVYINDFAKIMVHDPVFNTDKKPTAKEQKALYAIKDTLVKILARRGCDRETISRLMEKETWLGPEDSVGLRLTDEIISTGKKELYASFTIDHILNLFTPKKEKMEELINKLGLKKGTTEAEIANFIEGLKNQNVDANKKVADTEKALAEKEAEITGLKNKIAEMQKAQAMAIVENAIKEGKLKADTKDEMVEMCQNNMEKFQKLIGSIEVQKQTPISQMINQAGQQTEKRDYDWLQKNDPKELMKIKNEQPERFEQMFNEWLKQS